MLKNLRKNRLLSGLFLSFSTALLISGVFVPACAADDTANIPGVCTTFTQDCTPATGNVRMPVFLVDFADEHFSKDALTADNIALESACVPLTQPRRSSAASVPKISA